MLFHNVDHHPWRAIAFMMYTVQITYLIMDLVVNPGNDCSWHMVATTIHLLVATFLASYQIVRYYAVWTKSRLDKEQRSSPSLHNVTSNPDFAAEAEVSFSILRSRALHLLEISGLLQMLVASFAAVSYVHVIPSLKWVMFGLSIMWSLVNYLWTDPAVRNYLHYVRSSPGGSSLDIQPSSTPTSMWDVSRSVLCDFVGTHERAVGIWILLLAVAQAVLVAYQFVVATWLMQTSADMYAAHRMTHASVVSSSQLHMNSAKNDTSVSYNDNELVCYWVDCTARLWLYVHTLLSVWFFAQLCRVVMEGSVAAMIMRLEVWIRNGVLARQANATTMTTTTTTADPTTASTTSTTTYHPSSARLLERMCESAIPSVMQVHWALFGIASVVTLMVSTWSVLWALEWKIAILCLSLVSLLEQVSGSAMTTASVPSSPPMATPSSSVSTDAQVELQSNLVRRWVCSDAAMDLYVSWFVSFLTIAMIIQLAYDITEGMVPLSHSVSIILAYMSLIASFLNLPGYLRVIHRHGYDVVTIRDVLPQ